MELGTCKTCDIKDSDPISDSTKSIYFIKSRNKVFTTYLETPYY